MQVAPGITPALLERIVQARTDLSKADSREVMLDCREVFATKSGSDATDAALPAKGKNTTTPFKVALAAAKKKPGGGGTVSVGTSSNKVGEKGTAASAILPSPESALPQKCQEPVMISMIGVAKLEIM